jgi:hypothetical protein
MYLSRAYMNRLNVGQRMAMNFLSYVDAYCTGDSDLYTAKDAIAQQLRLIRMTARNARLATLSDFDELFLIQDDGLNIHVDKTKELCRLLSTQEMF